MSVESDLASLISQYRLTHEPLIQIVKTKLTGGESLSGVRSYLEKEGLGDTARMVEFAEHFLVRAILRRAKPG